MPQNYRKRRQPSKVSSYMSTAQKALSIALALKRLINVEVKSIDTIDNGFEVTTSADIRALTLVNTGVGNMNRVGDSLKGHANDLRYSMFIQSGAVRSLVRVIVFKDNASNGVLPLASALLEFDDNIHSPINYTNTKRFIIKYDRTHVLTGINSAKSNVYGRSLHQLTHIVRYESNSANQVDAKTGHMYVLFISDQPAVTAPTIRFINRFTFIDN